MKKTIFYKALRYGYRLLKRAKHALQNRIKPKTDRLLFTFGGRSEGWPGLGRELYNTYPEFASSIQYCNRILIENGGAEILSYFEGVVNENYFDDESRFTCITAIQIATVNHYNNKGIYPNAVMGVSMGEPSAAYAAGAITAEEALKVSAGYMAIHKLAGMHYSFMFLNLNLAEASQFCKESPIWAEVIYEDSPQAVIIACHEENFVKLESFMKSRSLNFRLITNKPNTPYHTSLIRVYHKLLKKEIDPKPLQCDYYSPTLGKCIAKNTILPADYWYDLACVPVLFNTALQSVVNDGYKIFLQIGPPAFSERQWNNLYNSKDLIRFNTFKPKFSEVSHFQSIIHKLSSIKLETSLLSKNNEAETLSEFLKNFNIHSIDVNNQLGYLRKKGEIHFLPFHNAWMIFGYDNTDQILKNPDVYSSSIYNYIDPVLTGADPLAHKVTRDILQPLFSSQTIAEMGRTTLTLANDLLNSVFTRDDFDLVKDFSDPLSQSVLCSFMGFTSSEEKEIKGVLGVDYHNSNFWERLGDYFNNDFDLEKHKNEENFLGKTYWAIESGHLTSTDGAYLLRMILTAGIATSSTLISTVISSINKYPELIEQVKDNDQLISKYIEECLRLETPAHYIRRITTVPVEISGKQLPAGSLIYLNLRSANRDPIHFQDPEKFSISRPAKRNLVFGSGIHQCIGMGMARSEARSAMQAALSRLEEFKKYSWGNPEYYKDSEVQAMTTMILKKQDNAIQN